MKEAVPPNAIAATFSYRVAPANGHAALHRTRQDQRPVWVSGEGTLEMKLEEPQTIYFETVGDATLDLHVAGYQIDNGSMVTPDWDGR